MFPFDFRNSRQFKLIHQFRFVRASSKYTEMRYSCTITQKLEVIVIKIGTRNVVYNGEFRI